MHPALKIPVQLHSGYHLRGRLSRTDFYGRIQADKLEFVGRADSQVVTNVVCFRSQPDPLGIVLRFGKLGICRAVRTCHSEPVRLSGVGISIEFRAARRHTDCPFVPFSGVHPREIVLLSGRLPRQCDHRLAMTLEFDKYQFVSSLCRPDIPDC